MLSYASVVFAVVLASLWFMLHSNGGGSEENAADRMENTCFIHVGKTAGSTLSCVFGVAHTCTPNSEQWNQFESAHDGSALVENVQRGGYVHMGFKNCSLEVDSLVVSVRNPLERIRSWFYYERKSEFPSTTNNKEDRKKFGQALLFVDCYSTLESLAVDGLAGAADNITALKAKMEGQIIPASIRNMTCPQRAWAAIVGARPFIHHNWYNYEYYNELIERLRHDNKQHPIHTLVVLRNEYLAEDWDSIHKLLPAAPLQRMKHPVSGASLFNKKVNEGKQKKKSSLSQEALDNLCIAMCVEMEQYTRLLQQARNLNGDQLQKSLQELQDVCPVQMEGILKGGESSCSPLPRFPRQDPSDIMNGKGKAASPTLWLPRTEQSIEKD